MGFTSRVTAVLSILLIPASALGVSPEEYLKLRAKHRPDLRLSYAVIQESPGQYVEKVFELRGVVDGFVRRDSVLGFMLTLEGRQAAMVNGTEADSVVITSPNKQRLRVLAKVADSGAGNVASLDALAVANDAELAILERELARKAPPAVQSPAPNRKGTRPAVANGTRGITPSRGGATLASMGVSALAARVLSPEAQQIYPYYRDHVWSCNKRLNQDEVDAIAVSLLYYCQAWQVDPRLAVAMIMAESDFRPHITSHKGAMGLGQIMPDEARVHRLQNPYDPVENLGAAIRILRGKLDRYRDHTYPPGQYTLNQIKLALASYNAGPGAVRKYGGVPPYKETRNYIKKILRIYSDLCGDPSIQ